MPKLNRLFKKIQRFDVIEPSSDGSFPPKIKKDFVDHMKDDAKYIHRNVSKPTETFNYGFNNTWEEYLIKTISKKDEV